MTIKASFFPIFLLFFQPLTFSTLAIPAAPIIFKTLTATTGTIRTYRELRARHERSSRYGMGAGIFARRALKGRPGMTFDLAGKKTQEKLAAKAWVTM